MPKDRRVYNISYSNSGGVGQVAAELNKELKNFLGLDSKHIYFMSGKLIQFNISLLALQLSSILDKLLVSNNIRNTLFSFYRAKNNGKLEKKISTLKNCTLIIHWFPGCLRYKNIENIIHNSNQLILVLHDTEIFTGGCHFSGNCVNYKIKCSKCPQVRKFFQEKIEKNFHLKVLSFTKFNNLVIVSPSQWLLEKAKESAMFSNATYLKIPNLISEIFSIYKSNQIDKSKSVQNIFKIGFIAGNVNDKRKGLDLLISAINDGKLKSLGVSLEVVGDNNMIQNRNSEGITYRGSISDKSRVFDFLSKLDLLVVPSYQDNYPSVILEAKAVGVPVLARAVGGITEMIEDQKTGIIFKDDHEFLEKLISALNHTFLKELGQNARNSFLLENSNKVIIEQWKKLII